MARRLLGERIKRNDWRRTLLARLGRHGVKHLLLSGARPGRIHLAVLVEPYLTALLDGRKTIESRFTRTRKPPYGSTRAGDVVLLKRSGGAVVGICTIAAVECFEVTPQNLASARSRHARAIFDETDAFWNAQAGKRFATLMTVRDVLRLPEIPCGKTDRAGWVVVKDTPGGGGAA